MGERCAPFSLQRRSDCPPPAAHWRVPDLAPSCRIVFAKYAKERSDCGSFKSGGDLGEFGPGEMQKQFEEGCRRAIPPPARLKSPPCHISPSLPSLPECTIHSLLPYRSAVPYHTPQEHGSGPDVRHRLVRLGLPPYLPYQVAPSPACSTRRRCTRREGTLVLLIGVA